LNHCPLCTIQMFVGFFHRNTLTPQSVALQF
jgi:hypothetical protein